MLKTEILKASPALPLSINVFAYDFPVSQCHPEIEIMFCLKGSMSVIVDGAAYALEAEDVFLVNGGVPHHVVNKDAQALCVTFSPNVLKAVSGEERYFSLNSSGNTESAHFDQVRHLLALLVQLNSGTQKPYATLSVFFQLLHLLVEQFSAAAPPERAARTASDTVLYVVNYIREHYAEKLTLAGLADEFGISAPYLSACFEKQLGTTFLAFYTETRLAQAVQRMITTTETLETVAEKTGFRNVRSFTESFKKVYGLLPSEWRAGRGAAGATGGAGGALTGAVRQAHRPGESPEQACFASLGGNAGTALTGRGDNLGEGVRFAPPASADEAVPGETGDSVADFRRLAKYLAVGLHGEGSGAALFGDIRLLGAQSSGIEDGFANRDIHIDTGIVDFSAAGTVLRHTFKKFCCVGSARQFLFADVQEMVRKAQAEIGYEFVKFHGILSDEMMVYHEDADGTVRYSFVLVDKVLDFLESVRLKPLVQLSFMPRELASDPDKNVDMGHFNTSPPKSLFKWCELVAATVSHLIERYGLETVRTWLFCVWNEPDSSPATFGWENEELFYDFYRRTLSTVKNIDSQLQFGSPSLLFVKSESSWAGRFFDFCVKNACEPDFLNIHYYDNSFPGSDSADFFRDDKNMTLSNILHAAPLQTDPYAFGKYIGEVREFLKWSKLKKNLPVYLTEWNLTVSHRDPINDTCFKACYLTKNLLQNYDRLDSFGYWCLTDLHEELQLSEELFHGGLGMFTYNGIPKAHYTAFRFAAHLGDTLLASGNGYFVTRAGKAVRVIVYNYEHYSKLFASGVVFEEDTSNRYAAFIEMRKAHFHLTLEHFPGKRCAVKEMYVNRLYGSSYDAWVRMGGEPLRSVEEYQFLEEQSHPAFYLHQVPVVNGVVHIEADLETLEVRFFEITTA